MAATDSIFAVKQLTLFEPSVPNPCPSPPKSKWGTEGSTLGTRSTGIRCTTIGQWGQADYCPSRLICRFFLQFDISGAFANAPVANLLVYRVSPIETTDLQGAHPNSRPYPHNAPAQGLQPVVVDWLGNVDLPIPVSDSFDDYSTPYYNRASLWTSPTLMTPSTVRGWITLDLLGPFIRAKREGHKYLTIRFRETVETRVSSHEQTNPHIMAHRFSGKGFEPKLSVTKEPITATPTSRTIRLKVLEPCVYLTDMLLHDQDRQDFSRAHGITPVRRGNLVTLTVSLRDTLSTFPAPYRNATVTLTLTAEDGTTVLNQVAMDRIDVGIYRYIYQTQNTDPLGLYRATCQVTV